MRSVDLDTLRRDWDGVTTHLKEDLGSSLSLLGSEEYLPTGIYVYGTATARLYASVMEGSSVSHPDIWCVHPSELPSMAEVAARIRLNRCLVLGRYQDEIYLVLMDGVSAEGQDHWHRRLAQSIKDRLGR